jgi:ABC-2 type transport system permease protein
MLRARWKLQVIMACAVKDIRTAMAERSVILQSVTLPVNYLIMMSLFVLAGSHAPTAVVMQDHGPYARQFVTAMRDARSFRLDIETAAQARAQMRQGTLVAVVTIPADFDRAVAHRQAVRVPVTINNLDEDLTDDADRAMLAADTIFYAHADPGAVSIVAREHDAYSGGTTGYIPFLAISVVVIALMVSGLLQAGNAAAREFEAGTVTELLLAPAGRWPVLLGRMLGAFTVALPAAAVVLGVVVFVAGDRPASLLLVAGTCLLTLAVFVAAGTALGLLVKDRGTLTVLTRAIPVPLFFLSGVFGAVTYQTRAVQLIADVLPIHYAIVLEQFAFRRFRTGTLPLPDDALILAAYLAAFAGLAALALTLTRHGPRRSRGRGTHQARWHRPGRTSG